jgi:hypothetical protein
MTVAPIFYLAISYFLGALLLVAAAHKILRGHQFRTSLAGYRILPENWLKPFGMVLALLEALVGVLLISGISVTIDAIAAAALFFTYGGLLVYALISGRGNMGCGCEWGEVPQPIRKWMVVRNILFTALALFLAAASISVSPTIFDIGNAAAAALALFLVQSSLAEIFAVSHRIKLIRLGA